MIVQIIKTSAGLMARNLPAGNERLPAYTRVREDMGLTIGGFFTRPQRGFQPLRPAFGVSAERAEALLKAAEKEFRHDLQGSVFITVTDDGVRFGRGDGYAHRWLEADSL
jgi:hypothetical protein